MIKNSKVSIKKVELKVLVNDMNKREISLTIPTSAKVHFHEGSSQGWATFSVKLIGTLYDVLLV